MLCYVVIYCLLHRPAHTLTAHAVYVYYRTGTFAGWCKLRTDAGFLQSVTLRLYIIETIATSECMHL